MPSMEINAEDLKKGDRLDDGSTVVLDAYVSGLADDDFVVVETRKRGLSDNRWVYATTKYTVLERLHDRVPSERAV